MTMWDLDRARRDIDTRINKAVKTSWLSIPIWIRRGMIAVVLLIDLWLATRFFIWTYLMAINGESMIPIGFCLLDFGLSIWFAGLCIKALIKMRKREVVSQ